MTVPVIETAPPETAETAVRDSVSPSGSVSFERSSDAAMLSGVSSSVVRTDAAETVAVVSSTATGAPLTSTVTVAVLTGSKTWMRWLNVSTTWTLPARSTATLNGLLN